MKVDLIPSMSFDIPGAVMNAAGARCTTEAELLDLAKTEGVSMVVTKSATLLPRDGNPLPRWCPLPFGGIQSMGLPNLGYLEYIEIVKRLKIAVPGKKVMISISGLSLQDNITMISKVLETPVGVTGFDAIELNLSCPNIIDKPILGYDFEQMEDTFKALSNLNIDRPLGLKLPPYFDKVHVKRFSELILLYPYIKFVTLINSVGNCMYIDGVEEKPVIKPNSGHGGLCGSYVKPVALGNVHIFRSLLGDRVTIIGAGGVSSPEDIYEFMLAGATAVQVGTLLEKEGVESLDSLHKGFVELMSSKKIDDLSKISQRLKML